MVFKRGLLLGILLIICSSFAFSEAFQVCMDSCQDADNSYPHCKIQCKMIYEEKLAGKISEEVEGWCVDECIFSDYAIHECVDYCDSFVNRETKFRFSECYDNCLENNNGDESFCGDMMCLDEYSYLIFSDNPRDYFSMSSEERKCVDLCILNDITPAECEIKCGNAEEDTIFVNENIPDAVEEVIMNVESEDSMIVEYKNAIEEKNEKAYLDEEARRSMEAYERKMQNINMNEPEELEKVHELFQEESSTTSRLSLIAIPFLILIIIITLIAYFVNNKNSGNYNDQLSSAYNKFNMQKSTFKFELSRIRTNLKNDFSVKKIDVDKFNELMDKVDTYEKELK